MIRKLSQHTIFNLLIKLLSQITWKWITISLLFRMYNNSTQENVFNLLTQYRIRYQTLKILYILHNIQWNNTNPVRHAANCNHKDIYHAPYTHNNIQGRHKSTTQVGVEKLFQTAMQMQLDVATNWVTAAKAMHLTRLSPINKKLTKKSGEKL